jgi:hypothetical protein
MMEVNMDLRLHQLESFMAKGSDGASYKVCGYELLTPDASLRDGREHWEPTGQVDYRLADGRLVEVRRNGEMRIAGTDVRLTPATKAGDGREQQLH